MFLSRCSKGNDVFCWAAVKASNEALSASKPSAEAVSSSDFVFGRGKELGQGKRIEFQLDNA